MIKELETLNLDKIVLELFSATNWSDTKIVLTGGISNYGVSEKVYAMHVSTGKWQYSLPDLNTARHSHASITLEDQVFVACGKGTFNNTLLSSVEMLDMAKGDQAWTLISIGMTSRQNPVFSPINSDQLMIMGGNLSWRTFSNSYMLSHKTLQVYETDPYSEIAVQQYG